MKAGTRLVTLGTSGGPPPRAHRAQSSNLLTVNGTHYVVDAGDGVARRLAKLALTFERSGLFLSLITTTIIQPVLVRCSRLRGIKTAPNRSMYMARPEQKSWSTPLFSISRSARRSGLPMEAAAYR